MDSRLERLKKFALDWRFAVAAVALLAALCRVELWREFLETPLDRYSEIPSLDMKLLLTQAQSFMKGDASLTLHRLLCATSALFTGGALTTKGVVLTQALLGILTGVFASLATLKLSGSRLAAFVAGVFAGCYSPALMYECFALKECVTLFFASFTLWTFAKALKGGLLAGLGHGLAAALFPLARPAGALWAAVSLALASALAWRRKGPVKALAPLALALGAALAITLLNARLGGHARFFDANVEYNLQAASIPDLKSYSVDTQALEAVSKLEIAARVLTNAPGKALALANACQTPDNVNYYFMKGVLPLLSLAPGPLLLIPAGLCGLALCVWLGLAKGRRRLLAAPLQFLCLALPICAFLVTGRYMLFLLPALAFGAGFFVHFLVEALRSRGFLKLALAAPLYALLLLHAIPKDDGLRVDDCLAYGLAANMKYGPCELEGNCYASALNLNPSDSKAAVNFSKWLLDEGRFAQASALLQEFRSAHPELDRFALQFNHALALLGEKRAPEAEKLLRSIGEPAEPRQKEKWLQALAWAQAMKNNALPSPEKSPKQE